MRHGIPIRHYPASSKHLAEQFISGPMRLAGLLLWQGSHVFTGIAQGAQPFAFAESDRERLALTRLKIERPTNILPTWILQSGPSSTPIPIRLTPSVILKRES
jgi:hypothetical protein